MSDFSSIIQRAGQWAPGVQPRLTHRSTQKGIFPKEAIEFDKHKHKFCPEPNFW